MACCFYKHYYRGPVPRINIWRIIEFIFCAVCFGFAIYYVIHIMDNPFFLVICAIVICTAFLFITAVDIINQLIFYPIRWNIWIVIAVSAFLFYALCGGILIAKHINLASDFHLIGGIFAIITAIVFLMDIIWMLLNVSKHHQKSDEVEDVELQTWRNKSLEEAPVVKREEVAQLEAARPIMDQKPCRKKKRKKKPEDGGIGEPKKELDEFGRPRGDSRSSGESRGSKSSGERRGSKSSGEWGGSRGPSEWRGSRDPGERRDSRGPSERRGSRSSAEWKGSRGPSERKDARGPSERKDARDPSERKDARGPSERNNSRGPSERKDARGPSERRGSRSSGEWKGSRYPVEPIYIRGPPSEKKLETPPPRGRKKDAQTPIGRSGSSLGPKKPECIICKQPLRRPSSYGGTFPMSKETVPLSAAGISRYSSPTLRQRPQRSTSSLPKTSTTKSSTPIKKYKKEVCCQCDSPSTSLTASSQTSPRDAQMKNSTTQINQRPVCPMKTKKDTSTTAKLVYHATLTNRSPYPFGDSSEGLIIEPKKKSPSIISRPVSSCTSKRRRSSSILSTATLSSRDTSPIIKCTNPSHPEQFCTELTTRLLKPIRNQSPPLSLSPSSSSSPGILNAIPPAFFSGSPSQFSKTNSMSQFSSSPACSSRRDGLNDGDKQRNIIEKLNFDNLSLTSERSSTSLKLEDEIMTYHQRPKSVGSLSIPTSHFGQNLPGSADRSPKSRNSRPSSSIGLPDFKRRKF